MRRFFSDSFRRLRCPILGAGWVLLLPILLGCSDGRPKRVPVSGRVLIDGKPLEVGFVQVTPRGDRAAVGKLGPEGRFTLSTFEENDGCVPGTHPVVVIANKNLNPTTLKWFAPKKYMSTDTSGLQIKVNGPRDDVEFHLTWKGDSHKAPFVEHYEAE